MTETQAKKLVRVLERDGYVAAALSPDPLLYPEQPWTVEVTSVDLNVLARRLRGGA